MFLKDKLNRREEVKEKAKELKELIDRGAFLSVNDIDKAVKQIITYIDELQNLTLLIKSANDQACMDIGDTKISLTTAIEVRKALDHKLAVINDLLDNDHGFNLFDLLDKRNKLLEEYKSISRLIDITDWSVKIE